jgi:DNA-binding IclR family transcriptional regulator
MTTPSRSRPLSGREHGLQSVERAITLMQVLAASGPARVTDLAEELGVHKSTASRLLATLERRGLADRLEDGASFVLGSGVALLAANAARPRSMSEVAHPILTGLAGAVGETVSINVLTDDGHVLTIEQAIGPRGITGFNWLGQRSTAPATAAGRVLLANISPGRAANILCSEVDPLVDHTVDRHGLLDDLPRIRLLGFATCRDDLEVGLSAVAAPVFGSTGVTAAVSASGPTMRIFGHRHHEITQRVMDAAEQLSARLGGRPSPVVTDGRA